MSNIAIFTDSTSDLSNEWLLENNVKSIPLTYIMDDIEYVDEVDDNKKLEFYNAMRSGKIAKTSAISTEKFINEFAKELEKGNDVFYTGLSGKLSATYSNSVLASQYLKEKYPDRKVVVTDSISTAAPLGMLIEEAVKIREENGSIEAIVQKVDELKNKLSAWFSVDDLQHLKRGGRISGAAAAIGSILNIKPILILDTDGSINLKDKVKGSKKVLKYFLNQAIEHAVDPVNDDIYIIHTDALELAEELKRSLENELNAKHIKIGLLSRIIGSHVGPGSLIMVIKTAQRAY